MVLSELVEFGPCVSAETVKACALIGLHTMAEANAVRSDSDSSPDLGEMWKNGCPRSPVWSGDGFEGEGSEGTSSVEYYEHNAGNFAIEVVGHVISLFLEDWELGRVALSCPLSMDLLCQEMWDACRGSSESLDFPRSLCSECQERRRRRSDASCLCSSVKPSLQAGDSFGHFVPSSE